MADVVTRVLRQPVLWAMLASTSTVAQQAPMTDPMRPPAAEVVFAAPSAGVDQAPAAQPGVPALVSIKRQASGARRALLNDRWLSVGEDSGDWRLTAIGSDSVLLASLSQPGEKRMLLLYGMEIKRLKPPP